jgi:uncharacterized phage-like protein YoqJ
MENRQILLSCALIGYRPLRFSFGYDEEAEAFQCFKAVLRPQISLLISYGVKTFYTGMDLGVSQWAASIVLEMRDVYQGVRLIAVIPCETQAEKWSVEQRDKYFSIVENCDEEILLYNEYTHSCMYDRDRFLVDHAKHLLSVYDGNGKGNTAHTIEYARKLGRNIIMIHPDTLTVTVPDDAETRQYGQLTLIRKGEETKRIY